jgi:aminoglycoside phosphotransferase
MGPFTNEKELYVSPASDHGFKSAAEYKEMLLRAKKIQYNLSRIIFTHGDFKAHNILVDDDGHLSGFLDCESAGWYPEYWGVYNSYEIWTRHLMISSSFLDRRGSIS